MADEQKEPQLRQLHMVWPAGTRPPAGALDVPDGYVLRPAGSDEDVAGFRTLMARVGLGSWDGDHLARTRATVVPAGWHVVTYHPGGAGRPGAAPSTVVATGFAQRNAIPELYPDGHEVGWIAADPDHGGRGLGRAITAAATIRLLDLGAHLVYLRTDDHRLPAVKTYLALGFVPHLWINGMAARWQEVCARLGWPFEPVEWARQAPRAGG